MGNIRGITPGMNCSHNKQWHGSHWDWKTWKKGKAFSSQGNLPRLEKEFYPKCWKIRKKIHVKIEKNTGEDLEICQPVMVKTLKIWNHTLNKKEL